MALKSAAGNQEAADYLLNKPVAQFYYNMQTRNRYVEWHNDQMKPKG